ncbi:MAG: GNAT family N-acetyltransferase [Burkholderiaceae bacterium]|jgi:RimJ/RimL family protein N-acetyltransferase
MHSAIPSEIAEQFESERLLLRCPRPEDGAVVFAAVVESLADLRAWPMALPWAQATPSIDASTTFCLNAQKEYRERTAFPMLLIDKVDGEFVGASGLHRIDWTNGRCEIGYWCRTRFRGQGLITEAVLAITRFAVASLGARRIECIMDATNLPSRRVCERAGYRLEDTVESSAQGTGTELRSMCTYAHT